MSYRDDLDALRARHTDLEREVADRQRDLAEHRRMLDEAEARVRLPVLDGIRVASPCSADWSQMRGDDRVRACGACNQHVFNLSDMTREEAEALIAGRQGRLCVRYFQRTDGTILLADCTLGARRRRRIRLVAGAALALAAGATAVAYQHSRAEAEAHGGYVAGMLEMSPPSPTPSSSPTPEPAPAPTPAAPPA